MKNFLLAVSLQAIIITSCAQLNQRKTQRVGGICEGCEAIFESPTPFKKLSWIDTLPDFFESGPKLTITGTVYKSDGKTPASNIVIYAYHTNQSGQYSGKGNETGWGRRHGYIRGWTKTNAKGQYMFVTNLPAAYPGRTDPAHIHLTVKEPDKNEYWIDDIVFADDPLLTNYKRKAENRGGNGIVQLERKNDMLFGRRDIYLGKNIPGYGMGADVIHKHATAMILQLL
jgi:protocatechuate 3,4-dioxygenase beta subunit